MSEVTRHDRDGSASSRPLHFYRIPALIGYEYNIFVSQVVTCERLRACPSLSSPRLQIHCYRHSIEGSCIAAQRESRYNDDT